VRSLRVNPRQSWVCDISAVFVRCGSQRALKTKFGEGKKHNES
jgi:hypothetical protein